MDRLLERPPQQRERRAVGRGRAAEVSFTVSSAFMTQVGIATVVITTLLAFAVGSGLLGQAARRSRRWVRAVLIAAALVAVVSGGAPLLPRRTPPPASPPGSGGYSPESSSSPR
jgi:hypothetical protein